MATVTASSSPTLARISGPGMALPEARVCARVPPRSMVARCGVSEAVTVRPVCGRAASVATMAASRDVGGLAAEPLERAQPASANPPATAAATNARRLR